MTVCGSGRVLSSGAFRLARDSHSATEQLDAGWLAVEKGATARVVRPASKLASLAPLQLSKASVSVCAVSVCTCVPKLKEHNWLRVQLFPCGAEPFPQQSMQCALCALCQCSCFRSLLLLLLSISSLLLARLLRVQSASKIGLHLCTVLDRNLLPYFWRIVCKAAHNFTVRSQFADPSLSLFPLGSLFPLASSSWRGRKWMKMPNKHTKLHSTSSTNLPPYQ